MKPRERIIGTQPSSVADVLRSRIIAGMMTSTLNATAAKLKRTPSSRWQTVFLRSWAWESIAPWTGASG